MAIPLTVKPRDARRFYAVRILARQLRKRSCDLTWHASVVSRSKPRDAIVLRGAKRVGVGAMCQRLIPNGQTIWIVDAHRDNGERFIGRGEEKLTAFIELEPAIRGWHYRAR